MFKQLSIKKLLTNWALGCSAIIFLLVFSVILTNKWVNQRHHSNIEKAIEIEKVSSKLIEIMSSFILRKSNIISAKTSSEIDKYKDRKDLEEKFEIELKKIRNLFEDDELAISIIEQLEADYLTFKKFDQVITDTQKNILDIDGLLRLKALQLELFVQKISNSAENIGGIIQLENSKARRKLRKVLEENNNELLVIEAMHGVYAGDNPRILKASNQVQMSVGQMVQLSRKIIQETEKDALVGIRDNEIIQNINIINTALGWMENDLQGYPLLLEKINYLNVSIDHLFEILIANKFDDSIYELRLKNLEQKDISKQNTDMLHLSVKKMMNDLEKLSHYTVDLSNSISGKTYKLNEASNLLVSVASFVVVMIILFGINYVVNRINIPLEKIKNGMSKLISGEFTVRLKLDDFSQDEFLNVASDFNRFAESNQKLIKELSSAKDALEESEHHTRAILENALVGIAHLVDRKFISVNQKFEELFGYKRDELEGLTTEVLFSDINDFDTLGELAYPLLRKGETYSSEWKVKRKEGEYFWCAISAKSIVEGKPEKGSIWLYEDITVKKETEIELKKLANFDTLTGLPNRSLFMDRLEHGYKKAKRVDSKIALLFIDLDRFKYVNDSLGHDAGDRLLRDVADRLVECVRDSDTVARLGGDEFTVLLSDVKSSSSVSRVANNIIASLARPFDLDRQEIIISPSIGISLFPEDGDDIATLLKNADAAMYSAKAAGRNNYKFYTKQMNERSLQQLSFENKLRVAAKNNDFMIYYQPLVDINSNELIGYEALLRWYHDELGLVSPLDFIPILEETGLINSVGLWVLETACQKIKDLSKQNNSEIRISINLSARQFQQADIVKSIQDTIFKVGLEPRLIDLEITESILMSDPESSEKILTELCDLGLSISLDDFGTGYSSLAYIKKFPISVLKIDRSFTRDILTDPSDAAICEAIVNLAKNLNIRVTAEGVETKQQLEYLENIGCHTAQGYLFGKPMPLDSQPQTLNRKAPTLKVLK